MEKEPPMSIMTRKSFYRDGTEMEKNPNPLHDPTAYKKRFYFFYGTLMDTEQLARVLHSSHRPQTYPAKINGYTCKLWGPYPALLDLVNGVVNGVAYEVRSVEEEERLQAYETDNYAPRACLVDFADGSRVQGRTFKWRGDESLLREGTFDLKDWQMKRLEGI